jgi:hypothetical protein
VLGRDISYCVKHHTDSTKKFSETEFLIDNIFVMFGGRVFQQTVGIPNIVSSERYAGAAGMLLHINGKFTMGKLKSSLCRRASFLTDPHCRFRSVGQGRKQTYLYLW